MRLLLIFSLVWTSGTVLAEEEEGESTEVSEESLPTNEPAMPRVGSLNFEALQQELLAKEFKAKEVVWLEAEYPLPEGESSASPLDPVKVLALKKESHKAQKQGAVLLLHDKEQHADWPYVIRPLRTILPKSGWYSLSVNLPFEKQYFEDVPLRSLPVKAFDEIVVSDELRQKLFSRLATVPGKEGEGNEGTETNEGEAIENESPDESENLANLEGTSDVSQENEVEKSVDIDLADPREQLLKIPYQKRALAHLEAAAAYLQNEGYQNIVLLTYGVSANEALNYVKQRQGQFSKRGFAIVMIDPELELEFQEDLTAAFGKNFPAPVLDLITKKDDRIYALASERKVSATVGGIDRYMQIFLPETRESMSETLPRRVRFWLEKYAPGMVVTGR